MLAVFLTVNLVAGIAKLYKDFSNTVDEVFTIQTAPDGQIWQLYFDEASQISHDRQIVAGVGVVLIYPQRQVINRAFSLIEPCTNTVENYNAY